MQLRPCGPAGPFIGLHRQDEQDTCCVIGVSFGSRIPTDDVACRAGWLAGGLARAASGLSKAWLAGHAGPGWEGKGTARDPVAEEPEEEGGPNQRAGSSCHLNVGDATG